MSKEGAGSSKLIFAAVFLCLEIAAIGLLSSTSTMQNIWLNRFSHRIMGSLWDWGENIRNYGKLGRQNEILSQENMELRRRLQEYNISCDIREVDRNMTLRTKGFRYTPASIVKMSRNNQHNYIILDKGSEDGIHSEDGIITSNGVVGIIDVVDKHFSYGITLMNVNSKISARIGRDGATGPMSWDGKSLNRAFLRELPLYCEYEKGDTVMTSGFSSIFPPDIPLGTAGESRMVNGTTMDVEVFLFQDFSAIRYVTIVENMGYETIKAMERENR